MAEVGGQLRCDGRTLKYETVVVGYFELQDTFLLRERERKGEVLGGGVLCPLCSLQPRSVPSSTLCSRNVSWAEGKGGGEIRQGAGRSRSPRGGSHIFYFLASQ